MAIKDLKPEFDSDTKEENVNISDLKDKVKLHSKKNYGTCPKTPLDYKKLFLKYPPSIF